jgi:hypothetical protein
MDRGGLGPRRGWASGNRGKYGLERERGPRLGFCFQKLFSFVLKPVLNHVLKIDKSKPNLICKTFKNSYIC